MRLDAQQGEAHPTRGGLRIGKLHKRVSKEEALRYMPTLPVDNIAAFLDGVAGGEAALSGSIARRLLEQVRHGSGRGSGVPGIYRTHPRDSLLSRRLPAASDPGRSGQAAG